MSAANYEAQIAGELRVFGEENVSALPPIAWYWSRRYVQPLLSAVGAAGIEPLWVEQIAGQCARRAPSAARLVSLGAGDGETELRLATGLAARGIDNLELVLVELNSELLARARAAAKSLGFSDRVRTECADLNLWTASDTADVYFANHSLHHVVELEHLYDQVSGSLGSDGVLLVNDMIGRNGHQRWPEALAILRRLWPMLDSGYRRSRVTGEIDADYPDTDFSIGCFEGTRAQDVLPLLLERVHPEVFVTFGNVIDPFTDRIYGWNFNPDSALDRELIDVIASIDEAGIDLGLWSPTHMIATFRPQPVDCVFPGERSPAHVLRKADEVVDIEAERSDPGREAGLERELRLLHERYHALKQRKAVRAALRVADARHQAAGAVDKLRSALGARSRDR
jgi:SAM-dependent methyltransferase